MSYLAPLSEAEITRMRKLFDTKISQLYNKQRQLLYEWRNTDWIENTTKTIETFDINLKSRKDIQLLEKYEVEERNGVKILLSKKHHNGDKRLQIIPIEGYFDALYDAHIRTGHSARFKMREYLKSKQIYMPYTAVVWFLKYCKICQAHRLAPMSCQLPLATMRPRKKIIDHHGFVELLDMRKQPDGEYVCVMHYRDISTNFTFLRPLRSPRIAEVADELLQLFLLIGCPSILHSPIAKLFTESVIQKLAVAWPDSLILCGEQMKPMKKTEGIEEGLRNWMRVKKSSNWSLGIYAVAHQMNLKKTRIKRHRQLQTPFKNMLGTNPKKGLDTQGLKPVLKNFKYEEDLKNILDLNYTDESSDSDDDNSDDDCVLVSQKERETPTSSVTRQTTLSHQTIPRQPVRTYIKKSKIQDKKTLKIDLNNGLQIQLCNSQEIDLPIGPKATTTDPMNADATSLSIDTFGKIPSSFDSDESDSSGDIKNINLLTEDVSGADVKNGHRSTVSEEMKYLRFDYAVKLEVEADDDLS